jgi:iron complex transport system substrate-binding protein
MGRWWLLSAAFVLWLAGGYSLGELRRAGVPPEAHNQRSPARIVSLAPDLTEILFALGLGDSVVGVTRDSDYPPAACAKSKVGTFWQPSIEAVIGVRPSLVVGLTLEQQRELSQRLMRMNYRCLTVDLETTTDLFHAIAAIGAATGANEQARELSERMGMQLEKLRAMTVGLPRVKVLWVVQREPLRVAGRDTFINEMIEWAGGENAIGTTLHKYPPVGSEQVIAAAPEVIVEPAMGSGALEGQRRQSLAYWHRYANVPAARDGRIYVIDGDVVSRLGPRLPAGVETIAKCLRPHLFGD